MPETPQAGALRTPSSSRQARCDDDMDAAPSQIPQQQPSPPPYAQDPIHDQPMNEGQTFNTAFHATQNIFDSHFNLHSGSQESDPITDLEQAFYQTCARHFYARFMPNVVNGSGKDMVLYYIMQILQHQFPDPTPAGSNNYYMANQGTDSMH